ncbi:cobyrinate a,c-diamide synthase [Marimonas arenosa]|uniref:Cobyrinate a,c-diamide synthase n=1 Tax=Marimonas arenosa TaxID=1795305 RepID=A0AAE3WBI6_9RHOB|nr:cobyrinate a,c-diamide synthase [Marimonas arenosa]MDQ2089370.1 cobyrinate a,c-diamide synthase [Marimonas arenosa]
MSRFPRFMISAAHKSSGKTVVSMGLSAAFRAAGDDLATFKKGPDYIDPMWLGAASGRPCYNLDFNAMEHEEIRSFFASRARGLNLVEANKGLYDGISPDGSDANAALAKLLDLPVVLVIDTLGMSRGIAPLLMGYLAFDREVNIAGVILNKVGGARHEAKLRRAVETYSGLPVLGAVWRNAGLEIGERHLGLTPPSETGDRDAVVERIGEIVGGSVDLDGLRALAGTAPDLDAAPLPKPEGRPGMGLRVGYARDAAFGFYYPDDLEDFEAAGAELVPIDMIRDRELPQIDALFIGGGFPEMRAAELAANESMRRSVKAALEAGLPAYAECGGLMYLSEAICWGPDCHEMVGFIPGRSVMHRVPQGRGYVRYDCTAANPWGTAGCEIKAHEFHYASLEGLPEGLTWARKITRGHGTDGKRDAIVKGNTVAGFIHLRSTGQVPWVPGFLSFVQRCKAGR